MFRCFFDCSQKHFANVLSAVFLLPVWSGLTTIYQHKHKPQTCQFKLQCVHYCHNTTVFSIYCAPALCCAMQCMHVLCNSPVESAAALFRMLCLCYLTMVCHNYTLLRSITFDDSISDYGVLWTRLVLCGVNSMTPP